MAKKVYKKLERPPCHPGKILKSGFIDDLNLPIEDVAKVLGMTRGNLSRIINGHQPVTIPIAHKLEAITKTPASQWLALQSNHDAFLLEQDENYQVYKSVTEEWLKLGNRAQKENHDIEASDKLVEKAGKLVKQLVA